MEKKSSDNEENKIFFLKHAIFKFICRSFNRPQILPDIWGIETDKAAQTHCNWALTVRTVIPPMMSKNFAIFCLSDYTKRCYQTTVFSVVPLYNL